MNIPFVDLKIQYNGIKEEILKEINEVLDSTAYICGKKAKKFEEDFAKMHNAKYCVALSTGTDALHVAFHALGIKAGDIITEINGKKYNLDNIYEMIANSESWKEGDTISVKIKRDGKEQTVTGKVTIPMVEADGYKVTDDSKKALREAWLKGK